MSRSKKTSKKKEKSEIKEYIIPELDNYDEEINKLYDSMANNERIIIKKDIELAIIEISKIPTGFSGNKAYMSLDIGIQYQYTDKEEKIKFAFYRYPLHIQYLEQFDVIKKVMNSNSLQKIITSINRLNEESKKFNQEMKDEYDKKKKLKKNKEKSSDEELEIEIEEEKEELLNVKSK